MLVAALVVVATIWVERRRHSGMHGTGYNFRSPRRKLVAREGSGRGH